MREVLIIHVEGQRYGVWKDEVESVKRSAGLHRLPLSPACIAGMSIIDDKAVTLADLPVCIGLPSVSDDGRASILMLREGGKISGFVVPDGIESLSLSADALVPMPCFLRTGVIDTCALHDAMLIPVINLHQLVQELLKTDHERPRAFIPTQRDSTRAAAARFRIFELGGEVFAADAEYIQASAIDRGAVTGLANVPAYVKGITVHENIVLPVIDLLQRMNFHAAESAEKMLITEIEEEKFGLLIDQDRGTRLSSDVDLPGLPPIACSSWLSNVLEQSGQIIPLVDLAALLSEQESAGTVPVEQRYHPDSAFSSAFKNRDVDIVEFSLLGARHAIPKSEVEDIVPAMPWRRIPGQIPEIMVGVAALKGKILPVLDLAMVFGRQSPAAVDWRMIIVKNGDFNALVMTEAVFGERSLPLSIQRTVPILLPHNLVYGCYPDGEAVRLILNIEAMAVHFEKSLIRELLPALSHGMKQAQDVASMPLASKLETSETSMSIANSIASEPFMSGAVQEEVSADRSREEGQEEQTHTREAAGEPAATGTSAEIVSERAQEASHEVIDASYSGVVSSEDQAELVKENLDFVPGEEAVAAVTETTNDEAENKAIESPEKVLTEETTAVEALQEFPVAQPAVSNMAELEPTYVSDQERPDPKPVPAEEEPLVPEHCAEKEPAAVAHARLYQDAQGHHNSRKWLRYAATAAVLAAVVFGINSWNRKGAVQQVKLSPPVVNETKTAKAESIAVKHNELPVQNPRPSLVLEIPANRPIDIDVYIVMKGDTLWGVSKRFTGNPFNYPRIAGENRIADPDLIFPGQKIRLQRK